ncbi:MAG: S8 family serine peptidase [Bacteroidales bacterium]|nr:S8 family serine peptidase [Bacteroidales bacterium]
MSTKAEGFDLSSLGEYTMTRTFPPAGKWEARHRAAGLHLWYDIRFDPSLPLTKAGEAVGALDEVEEVEFVLAAKPQELSYPFNDPKLPRQWHYQNPGGTDQWAEGCDVNAFNAWTIEVGRPEVIVAVNDMGVDYTHEDLAANMWVNKQELNGKDGEDDDGNGYIDDIYGYSFMTYDGQTTIGRITPGDHGTHVAGTIAAVNDNGIGVSGIAGGNGSAESGVRIMSTQTLDGQHGAMTPDSFVYAADNGAVLINCSWGFVNNEQATPKSYVEAIDYFNENAGFDESGVQTGPMAGGLIIFAAGNDGREIEHPAMDENVFSVAALSANYVRSYFTSYGEWVDISAPGGDANRNVFVLSTLPENEYGNMQGSSMAAPHVTGVAALIVSYYGVGRKGFTRDKLIYLMQSTANKRALEENGSYATRLGAGLIDAYAALKAEASEVPPQPVTDLKAAAQSNYINVNWTVPAADEGSVPYAYDIFYSKSSLSSLNPAEPGSGVQSVRLFGAGKNAGDAMSATLSGLDFGTAYHIRICTENLMGEFSSLSAEKTVRTDKNNPPVIKALDGTSLTLPSFDSGTLRFEISDADGHELTYSLSEGLAGLSPAFEDGLLTLTVNALQAEEGKTYDGILSASDGYETTTLAFSYKILSNSAPVATGEFGDQLLNATSEQKTFTLSDYFNDPDGEELTYTVGSSSTSIIVNSVVEDGVLTLTGHSYGSTTITVRAQDARGASVEQSFRVLLRDNSRPYDLYPNPVKDVLYLRAGEEKTVDLTISNKAGAVVFAQENAVLDPFAPLSINLKEQPGGVYYVRIGDDRYTIVKQ